MTIMMFHKKPVALDRDIHRAVRINPPSGFYSFAASINSVPVTIGEMSAACVEYPIVFTLNADGSGMPIALLGVREKENLFVDAEGKWNGDYIPAMIRSYPFALHQTHENEKALIVMDEDYPGLSEEEGVNLFSEDGNQTPQLARITNMLQEFAIQEQASVEFVRWLKQHDLLVARVLDVKGPNDTKFGLNDFYVIDEERVGKLDDASLISLARSGALGFIYAHLISMNSLPRLMARLGPRMLAGTTA